jgi:catechol 2,3-dioxygenase-like lactoylglutathione lyase family enzyme
MLSLRALVTAAVVGSVTITNALAQPSAPQAPTTPPVGAVLGTGAVTSFVEDMDKSLAFYHEAFGMEVPELPASGARPYNPSNVQLFAMFDIAGAKERHQTARLGDARVEVMEIQQVDHKTIPLRLQDPGTVTLVFIVKDVDASLARARAAGAAVATSGGAPVKLADGSRSAMIKDVDGRFIELRQPGAAAADAPALLGMRVSIAVEDLAQTLAIYRDLLGFTVEEDENFGADARLRTLTGLSTASFHRTTVRGPGTSLPLELVQYGGVDRKAHAMRIQDRGAARMQVRADDVGLLVDKMRGAGLRVVSVGGGPVPIPPNFMGALVADPNNFFLTVIAPCATACAPRLISESEAAPGNGAPAQH